MKRDVLEALLADRCAKRSAVLITRLDDGAQWLLHSEAGDAPPLPALEAEIAEALARDVCRVAELDGGRFFVQPFQAPVRLVLVGAVHIAQPLASMATRVGFAVTVVDPRSSFASDARFPGVALRKEWPDEALRELALDRRTALLTLTHDPKLDDPALAAALRSACFYVGALGSRKNHAARLLRLRKLGFGDADLARVHGPAGLPIRAASPAEIAVSMLAEVIQCLRADGE